MRRMIKISMRARQRILLWSVGLALAAAALASLAGFSADSVTAAPLPAAAPKVSSDVCLACHEKANMLTMVGNEEILLTIDPTAFADSSHGKAQLGCVDCHTDIKSFPHPEYGKSGLREFDYSLYEVTRSACQGCHNDEAAKAMSGVHQQTLEAGNHNAAMCADCHNPHYVEDTATRAEVPDVCARCHSDIAATYKESVHGAALIDEGNQDVPNCIVCHGNHNITDPRTVEFRNDIPLLCARCHTDSNIMDKYGISTNVMNTYVADYHGTTVTLFEQSSPNLPTNKPVCIDCHGTHNISKTDNPQTGIALKENLLVKCQRCHPDATANFPDAWMSHYIASPDKYPLVYYVNLFYKFFIPAVIGGMLVFVISDMIRRTINRRKGAAH
jgi:predicted CXXCH cytochrome family protein